MKLNQNIFCWVSWPQPYLQEYQASSVGFRGLNPTYKSIKLEVGWVEQSET
ncbi:MAG: hypothetical protein O4859_15015 [Trichodesmium sp. St18_bin1]|nr:hypothetical protein [Trichodesmium sp. St18_bin1]